MNCLYNCKKDDVITSSYDSSIYLNPHNKQPLSWVSGVLIRLQDSFHMTGMLDVSDVIADEGQILKIRSETKEDTAGEMCK